VAHPRVVISVLNRNGWRDTIECLASVRNLNYSNYLTVVVDNGSTDGSVERMRARAEEKKNEGFVLAEYGRLAAVKRGKLAREQGEAPHRGSYCQLQSSPGGDCGY
jgi:glycosyltransferase involved in cell wall biosynthesis